MLVEAGLLVKVSLAVGGGSKVWRLCQGLEVAVVASGKEIKQHETDAVLGVELLSNATIRDAESWGWSEQK